MLQTFMLCKIYSLQWHLVPDSSSFSPHLERWEPADFIINKQNVTHCTFFPLVFEGAGAPKEKRFSCIISFDVLRLIYRLDYRIRL